MQLWNMKSLGVSSEDFMNVDSQNAPSAFYGTLWKFAKDKTGKAMVGHQDPTDPSQGPQPSTTKTQLGILTENTQQRVADDQAKRIGNGKPLDNHLVDEAKAQGHPVSQPDSAFTDEHNAQQQEADLVQAQSHATIHSGQTEAGPMTEASLKKLTIEDLQGIGSSLGVLNLKQKKQGLIEAILAKQS